MNIPEELRHCDLSKIKRFAVSDGRILPLLGSMPTGANKDSITNMFNICWNTGTDNNGAYDPDSERYPDGHLISPFRHRDWEIMSFEELAALRADEKQKESWEALHRQDDDRRKEYREQSARWFEALGRFVAAFEAMVAESMTLVHLLLRKNGVGSRKARDLVIADLEAHAIQKLARSLFACTVNLGEKEGKIVDAIFKRVEDCITSRNDIVHSCWQPGGMAPAKSFSFASARGTKFKKEKSGESRRRFDQDQASLTEQQSQCDAARFFLSDLCNRVTKDRPLNYFLHLNKDMSIDRVLNYKITNGYATRQRYDPHRKVKRTIGKNEDVIDPVPGIGHSMTARVHGPDELIDVLLEDLGYSSDESRKR